ELRIALDGLRVVRDRLVELALVGADLAPAEVGGSAAPVGRDRLGEVREGALDVAVLELDLRPTDERLAVLRHDQHHQRRQDVHRLASHRFPGIVANGYRFNDFRALTIGHQAGIVVSPGSGLLGTGGPCGSSGWRCGGRIPSSSPRSSSSWSASSPSWPCPRTSSPRSTSPSSASSGPIPACRPTRWRSGSSRSPSGRSPAT